MRYRLPRLVFVLTVVIAVALFFLILSSENVLAQPEGDNVRKVLEALRKEQRYLEKERQRLEQHERNLKILEAELERKYDEYLQREKVLREREIEFEERVERRIVNRQVIETYESMEAGRAAVLIKSLYDKDRPLALLIMRKISGKKAGRILEALVYLDRPTAESLAREILEPRGSESR
jgi:flagellar motility protein MotE (MotC chaperone)